MNGLRTAVGFLTVFPVGTHMPSGTGLASARGHFSLVGLMLGALLYGINETLYAVFSPMVLGALLATALVVLTRALHVDGFIDSCDGLFGGYDRERRLEIFRDSRVGAFGAIGGVLLLLLKWTAIVSLPSNIRTSALVLFPCFPDGACW